MFICDTRENAGNTRRTGSTSHSPNGTHGQFGSAAEYGSRLQHVTVEHDGIAVCTMFPQALDEDAVSTEWITATTESFVALEERR